MNITTPTTETPIKTEKYMNFKNSIIKMSTMNDSTLASSQCDYTNIAHRLHSQLSNDLIYFGHDQFAVRHSPDKDTLVQSCVEFVKSNEYSRKYHSKGPTAVRFTSKYWRQWNSDLKILEQQSQKTKVKKTKAK